MKDLHKIQMQILRELTFRPSSKTDDVYSLTTKGKKFCSHIDTQTNTLEKQPKISVLIIPHKVVEGKDYYLVQRRGKEPYFGYVGFMTGKIRFGENLWLDEEGFYAITPKFHNEIQILEWYKSGTKEFFEESYFIEKF